MRVCDRVMISGRTMLSPTLCLTGMEAIVMPPDPRLPKGTVLVMVDWEGGGYEDASELPRFCNVPEEHLSAVSREVGFWPKPDGTKKPSLRLI